jgi:hypothetical protein
MYKTTHGKVCFQTSDSVRNRVAFDNPLQVPGQCWHLPNHSGCFQIRLHYVYPIPEAVPPMRNVPFIQNKTMLIFPPPRAILFIRV